MRPPNSDSEEKATYYQALSEKTRIQAEIERMKLLKLQGELIEMSKVKKLEGLVSQFMRELQKKYSGDKELMDRIADFSLSWTDILKD